MCRFKVHGAGKVAEVMDSIHTSTSLDQAGKCFIKQAEYASYIYRRIMASIEGEASVVVEAYLYASRGFCGLESAVGCSAVH